MGFQEDLLKDKRIIITGGGSGLGLAMTHKCLELGATCTITGRSEEKLAKAAEGFNAQGRIFYHTMDVRKPEEVETAFSFAAEKMGGVNALLNNAAGNFISPTERLSPNAFRTIVDIVLNGTFNCTNHLGKQWLESGTHGTVVNIATTYASSGSGYVVPSACAKAGVVAMTKSLASEWGSHGIRLNAIAPGAFPTKGAWERLLPGELMEKFDPVKRIPLARVGEHEELANLAAFLFSELSSYMTGECITLDGGEQNYMAGQFNMLKAIPKEMWDAIEVMTRGAK